MDKKPDNRINAAPSPMTEARLRVLIESYGGRAARWPESERTAATALLARVSELQHLAAQAARLDAVLDRSPSPAPPASLENAIRNLAAPPLPAPRPRRWKLPRLEFLSLPAFRPAALALATVLGIAYGLSGALSGPGAAPPFHALDVSLIAGGSQLVGVGYMMEENR